MFRNIYTESPIGIELFDIQGLLIDANKACLDIFGISDVSEVRGFCFFDDPNITEDVKENLRNGNTVRFETRFDFEKVKGHKLFKTTKSGIIYLDVLITPIGVVGNRPMSGYMVQLQDITERKRAEEELKQVHGELEKKVEERTAELKTTAEKLKEEIAKRIRTEEELRQRERQLSEAQKIANVGSWEWDITTDRIACSDQLYRIIGVDPGEFGSTYDAFLNIIHPDDRKAFGSALKKSAHEGRPLVIEHRIIRPDGNVIYMYSLGEVIHDERGKVVLMRGTGQDITERKLAERALTESGAKWRSLVENAPDIIMTTNREGRILFINSTPEGLSVEETLGTYIYDYVPQRYHETVRQSIERVFRTGTPDSYEIEARGPRDTASWYSTRVGPIVKDGEVKSVTLITRDITDRKKMEEALRKSEMRLAEAQKIGHIGSFEWDVVKDRIIWSDELRRIFGYESQECAADYRSLISMVHPDDRELITRVLTESLKKKKSYTVDYRIIRQDGTVVTLHSRGEVVSDEFGKAAMVKGVAQDITERKRMEEEMRVKDNAVAASINAIVFADLEGKLTYANSSFIKMWGYDKEDEVIGKSSTDFYLTPEKARKIIEDLRLNGSWTGEMAALRKDGTSFHVHMSANLVLDKTGAPICVMASCVDISEQKRMEEKLREMSITDDLTGLLNRRGFMLLADKQLKMAEREEGDLFLLFADMDNLKVINDKLGHKTGDRSLRETAELMKKTFRESDIIGRVGGDEYAVLLTGTAAMSDEISILRRLEEHLKSANMKKGREYNMSLSTGIVRYDPDKILSIDELMSKADTLMYANKKKKKSISRVPFNI